MRFTVPLTGYYTVSAQHVCYKRTGKFEIVHNPKYKWWSFWRVKTVIQEVYEPIVDDKGTKIMFLNTGEQINSSLSPRRLE